MSSLSLSFVQTVSPSSEEQSFHKEQVGDASGRLPVKSRPTHVDVYDESTYSSNHLEGYGSEQSSPDASNPELSRPLSLSSTIATNVPGRESSPQPLLEERDLGDYELTNLRRTYSSTISGREELIDSQESIQELHRTSNGPHVPGTINPKNSTAALTTVPTRRDDGSLPPIPETELSHDVSTSQMVPPEIGNLWREFMFVIVCSFGQLLFSFFLGNITVNQTVLIHKLGIPNSQSPWLIGSLLLANGLSVVLSGSLADLASPKHLMVGAFAWLTVWHVVGAFSISPSRKVLFFIMRAMQGIAVGVLVSASMSILGRIYKPGLRKTRVFSGMAAMAPFGFWLGCLQGGALSEHLPWIFGSNAMLCGLCTIAAFFVIPPLSPAKDQATSDPPSLRNFDFYGAALSVAGCASLLFGLTQGTSTNWSPYTYVLVIVGLLLLGVFYFVEGHVSRPLIPKKLWATPGFAPLVLSYFLGFGSYSGAWQYYALQFFLNIQHRTPLTVSLYLIPNAIFGVLATFLVSKTLHVFPGHVILIASMIAYALGPVFFLPQSPSTSYWALSMPGIALVTFGPDLSFAAASIFVTSSVERSYQGAAGSLLLTVQNLSAAVCAALGDTVGTSVGRVGHGENEIIGMEGLKAAWWFSLALALTAVVVTGVFVRIPKSVEKEHVS